MKKTYIVILNGIIVLLSGSLLSQNLVKTDTEYSDTVKASFSLNVEGSFQKGNTDIVSILSGEDIKITYKKLETIIHTYFDYGESDGLMDQKNILPSFTLDLWYKSKISPFFLQTIEYSFEKEIDLRSQTGAGVKYTFLELGKEDTGNSADKLKISISGAGIHDYTNLKDRPGNYDCNIWRISLRFKAEGSFINSLFGFSHITFFQPSVKRLKNAIWRSDTQFLISLTDLLSFSTTFRYTHQDVVPMGVKNDDYKLTFGFSITL